MSKDNPILNNPYEEPKQYYSTDPKTGTLDYSSTRKGRRPFTPEIPVLPTKQKGQKSMFDVSDIQAYYELHLINQMRKEVSQWRKDGYKNTTRVTYELLTFWFNNPERHAIKKLFFAQQEAVETAIWLNEVAEKSNPGQNILRQLQEACEISSKSTENLSRIAFKMATGSGKTVVMAMLIVYHYFNRKEYRNDTRYTDNFLIITPGITIRDRLGVLFVDTQTTNLQEIQDYYRIRGLIPKKYEHLLYQLNAHIVITNYHSFEARTLQGNKRSPFDGKFDAKGKKQEAKEDANLMLKRALGKFKAGSRLLVINDEAHHCYMPKEKETKKEKTKYAPQSREEKEETKEENKRAAVWYNGLLTIARKFKVSTIYDLSATPYFLNGSGYQPYTLFPWVVSDFGLIEAIESGLVKIPYLPVEDDTHELTEPKLKDIYNHVKDKLPKKGAKKEKLEGRPKLPPLVIDALHHLYNHYEDDYHGRGKVGQQRTIEETPPVLILVCNNTNVSSEVFKYVAGFEEYDEKGNLKNRIPGSLDLFSNFDQVTGEPLKKPPTILIDSNALENSGQIDTAFKKVFEPEIEQFKRDYRILYPDRSVDNITDVDLLREIVNTVGDPSKLGSHVRCVVSVSMLTEGWDANTVTHIMGLRAFGSQLLCEQVAGRALRRKHYFLGKDGKFPPEYAQIIGVPFKLFKGGATESPEPPDHEYVHAIPERQEEFEITFPNVDGYRIDIPEGMLTADFSDVPNFEVDGTNLPTWTEMGAAILEETEKLTTEDVREMRDQEIIYRIARALMMIYFQDEEDNAKFHKFGELKDIVEYWYNNKVVCLGNAFKQMLYFYLYDPKMICEHIKKGIEQAQAEERNILPILNHYNKFGSTKHVHGNTSRPVYPTQKSHVNLVVADSVKKGDNINYWEHIAAKTLEEMPQVHSYVKNNFLGFTIPYINKEGVEKQYYPDFIARCTIAEDEFINLCIEITGMNTDKYEKKYYVENFWLPAVNAVRVKHNYPEWHFIEIANDIRSIKQQIENKIAEAIKQREQLLQEA